MILRTEIWVRLVCGLMLIVRVVDGQGQLEAEEGMLGNACLQPGFMQSMSARTLDPRTAVAITDKTCDDVTIIPATGPRNNNLVRWLTHDAFVDWACTLVFVAYPLLTLLQFGNE